MTAPRWCCFVARDSWSGISCTMWQEGKKHLETAAGRGKHSKLFCCCLNLKTQIGVGKRKECFPRLGVVKHPTKDIQVSCVSNLKYSRNFSRNYSGNNEETSSFSYLNPNPGQDILPNEHLSLPHCTSGVRRKLTLLHTFGDREVWNSLVFVISLLKMLLVTFWFTF